MTPVDFQRIKEKIESAKSARDRAEGAKQKIEQMWKKEFSVSTIEEVIKRISEYEKDISIDKLKLNKLYTQLESVTNWDE